MSYFDSSDDNDQYDEFGQKQKRSRKPIVIFSILGLVAICLVAFIIRARSTNNLPEDDILLSQVTLTITPPLDTPITESLIPTLPTASLLPSPTTINQSSTTITPTHTIAPALAPAFENQLSNLEELKDYMLDLINQDRLADNLSPVKRDSYSDTIAQSHAEDMLEREYFSHWNLEGLGPDHRYAFSGGIESAQENISFHSRTSSSGTPISIFNWEIQLDDIQAGLMDSPGHRENILYPYHTHVGIGLAYGPSKGKVYLSQEFINRYITLRTPIAPPDSGKLIIEGELLPGASQPFINLAYEDFPKPKTHAELAETGSYTPQGEFFYASEPEQNGNTFWAELPINQSNIPGLYHILIWVNVEGEEVQAADALVVVGEY